jgi:hypothetical protein
MSQDTLYHRVSYAGTQEPAARLQRMTGRNEVDAGDLAEEMAGLGKRELRDLRSHLRKLLIHLLKLAGSPSTAPKAHWRVGIRPRRGIRSPSPPSRPASEPPGAVVGRARSPTPATSSPTTERPASPADSPCPVAADDLLGANFARDNAAACIEASFDR